MWKIEWTTAFKRDFKRYGSLASPFIEVLWTLTNDEKLSKRFCDHALSGDWKDFQDCHIKPDLVLIYRKPDAKTLQLVRLGSYSELGL
jgi:mRNA interferase YafQ